MKYQVILFLAFASLLLFTNASDRLRPQRPLNNSVANPPDNSNLTNQSLSNLTNTSPRPEGHEDRPLPQGPHQQLNGSDFNLTNQTFKKPPQFEGNESRPHLQGPPHMPRDDGKYSSNSTDHQTPHHSGKNNNTMNKNHTVPHNANETADSDAARVLVENNSTHNASHRASVKDHKKPVNVSRDAHPYGKNHTAPHFANKTHHGDKNSSMDKNHTDSDASRLLTENRAAHNATHKVDGKENINNMNVSELAHPLSSDKNQNHTALHFANKTHPHDDNKNRSIDKNHTVGANETANPDAPRLLEGAEEGAMNP